jgi:gamma-glutamylcyclotransferase (GGCT)/AIG2-like uncharacterized protein YtfP
MRLFVYGTLMRGYGLNHYLTDCAYLGRAVTDKSFVLLDSGFPVMVPLGCGKVRVEGEVYDVESRRLIERLDNIESAYNRAKIDVRYVNDGALDKVHAYLGKPDWWSDRCKLGTEWHCGDGIFRFRRLFVDDPLPEGVVQVNMDDPEELHNTIKDAIGE